MYFIAFWSAVDVSEVYTVQKNFLKCKIDEFKYSVGIADCQTINSWICIITTLLFWYTYPNLHTQSKKKQERELSMLYMKRVFKLFASFDLSSSTTKIRYKKKKKYRRQGKISKQKENKVSKCWKISVVKNSWFIPMIFLYRPIEDFLIIFFTLPVWSSRNTCIVPTCHIGKATADLWKQERREEDKDDTIKNCQGIKLSK